MHKVICDCCGREGADNKLDYLCHLGYLANGGKGDMGYVDRDFNSTSGRYDRLDLCNKCYNIIVAQALTKFYELKQKNTGFCYNCGKNKDSNE